MADNITVPWTVASSKMSMTCTLSHALSAHAKSFNSGPTNPDSNPKAAPQRTNVIPDPDPDHEFLTWP